MTGRLIPQTTPEAVTATTSRQAELNGYLSPTWALGTLAKTRRSLRGVLHPLGFLCLPLLRTPRHGVCVHVWGCDFPSTGLVTSAVHAHSWDLFSTVLFGQIGNHEVSTETVPREKASHRVYEIKSAQGADRIIKTSQYVRCARGVTHYAAAGVAYQLKGGAFHTTEVADDMSAATVLIALPIAGGGDRSLGPLDLPGCADSWLVRRRTASASITRQAIDTVLDHAEALPSACFPISRPTI